VKQFDQLGIGALLSEALRLPAPFFETGKTGNGTVQFQHGAKQSMRDFHNGSCCLSATEVDSLPSA